MDDLIGGGLLSQAPQVAVEKVIAIFDFEAQAEGDLGEFNKRHLNLNGIYSRNMNLKSWPESKLWPIQAMTVCLK